MHSAVQWAAGMPHCLPCLGPFCKSLFPIIRRFLHHAVPIWHIQKQLAPHARKLFRLYNALLLCCPALPRLTPSCARLCATMHIVTFLLLNVARPPTATSTLPSRANSSSKNKTGSAPSSARLSKYFKNWLTISVSRPLQASNLSSCMLRYTSYLPSMSFGETVSAFAGRPANPCQWQKA